MNIREEAEYGGRREVRSRRSTRGRRAAQARGRTSFGPRRPRGSRGGGDGCSASQRRGAARARRCRSARPHANGRAAVGGGGSPRGGSAVSTAGSGDSSAPLDSAGVKVTRWRRPARTWSTLSALGRPRFLRACRFSSCRARRAPQGQPARAARPGSRAGRDAARDSLSPQNSGPFLARAARSGPASPKSLQARASSSGNGASVLWSLRQRPRAGELAMLAAGGDEETAERVRDAHPARQRAAAARLFRLPALYTSASCGCR